MSVTTETRQVGGFDGSGDSSFWEHAEGQFPGVEAGRRPMTQVSRLAGRAGVGGVRREQIATGFVAVGVLQVPQILGRATDPSITRYN